ncbi:MAG: YciI family protein, partial [Pseudomonadota bacterium]
MTETNFPDLPPVVPMPATKCYLVLCKDTPGSARMRAEHLKGHLDHVEKHWTRYITAGPLREPGGEALLGSLFLVLAHTLEEARTLMEGDPYITCGMYETIEYKELTSSIGRYPGGKIW